MGTAVLRREPLALGAAASVGLAVGLLAAWNPLAAVVALVGIVAVVVVITRAELVLLVMIAALPWENKLHYPSATLSTVKGIGALVLVAYLLRLVGDRRTTIRLPPLLGIVALFGVWVGLSMVVAPEPLQSVQEMVRWILFFAFFFLIVQLVDGRPEIRRALRWFTTSVAAAALYGLWQFVVGHSSYRVDGPLEDPNDFAYLLACTLPIAVYLMSADRRRRPLWGACFVVIAAAMLATFSRGALVGLGAVLLWGAATRRIPLWVLASGLVSALVVVAFAFTVWRPLLDIALHEKTHIAQSNTESREAFWTAALQLTAGRPLTGVGPGRYPKEAAPLLRNDPIALKEPITHNTYLQIVSESGIPALLLFLAYLLGVWLLLRAAQRRAARDHDRDERRLATALQASLIIAIVSGTFLSEQLAAPFWLLGGLAVVLARDAGGARQLLAGMRRGEAAPTAPPP
ncbi:MAG TPA: O-antigen ligase family protein [Solirubrobacteraceae bacterium]|jgi:putative inorganic carbon (HCO3(-)) transporter|nr:O-antigen ligase family protein [Solirubrobacteraceae bacterium]